MSKTDLYILVGQTPVPEPDGDKWGAWWATADRIVAQTEVGASLISTVFLGIDHQYGAGMGGYHRKGHKGTMAPAHTDLRSTAGPPILFETMIFTDGDGGGFTRRCSTWPEAEKQHAEVVAEWTAHIASSR
jgi:hypothetical protein